MFRIRCAKLNRNCFRESSQILALIILIILQVALDISPWFPGSTTLQPELCAQIFQTWSKALWSSYCTYKSINTVYVCAVYHIYLFIYYIYVYVYMCRIYVFVGELRELKISPFFLVIFRFACKFCFHCSWIDLCFPSWDCCNILNLHM